MTAEIRRKETRKHINSCTVKHMNIKGRTIAFVDYKGCLAPYILRSFFVFAVGDDILLKAPEGVRPYVARVMEITADREGRDVRIAGAWYYRPEDTKRGRRNFHGTNELFRSDHLDIQLPESVEGKCKVHTFKNYMNFDEVDETDYFYRMDYNPNTEDFSIKRLEVFCVCNLPWNPDLVMVKCDDCDGWYHPECLGLSREEARSMDVFICSVCQYLQSMVHGQTDEQTEERPRKRPRTDNDSPTPSVIPADDARPRTDNDSQTPSVIPADDARPRTDKYSPTPSVIPADDARPRTDNDSPTPSVIPADDAGAASLKSLPIPGIGTDEYLEHNLANRST